MTRAAMVDTRVPSEKVETGSRETYFEKCCYQEKARNRKVGKGKHKIENFF